MWIGRCCDRHLVVCFTPAAATAAPAQRPTAWPARRRRRMPPAATPLVVGPVLKVSPAATGAAAPPPGLSHPARLSRRACPGTAGPPASPGCTGRGHPPQRWPPPALHAASPPATHTAGSLSSHAAVGSRRSKAGPKRQVAVVSATPSVTAPGTARRLFPVPAHAPGLVYNTRVCVLSPLDAAATHRARQRVDLCGQGSPDTRRARGAPVHLRCGTGCDAKCATHGAKVIVVFATGRRGGADSAWDVCIFTGSTLHAWSWERRAGAQGPRTLRCARCGTTQCLPAFRRPWLP